MCEAIKTADTCKCGKAGSEEPKKCPYQDDVNDEAEYCNCCDNCRQDCADDI